MQITPRTRYGVPNYPTALEMRACPEILLRHVPKSWPAKEESKEQLRQQIRDLIAWFEAQGVN